MQMQATNAHDQLDNTQNNKTGKMTNFFWLSDQDSHINSWQYAYTQTKLKLTNDPKLTKN